MRSEKEKDDRRRQEILNRFFIRRAWPDVNIVKVRVLFTLTDSEIDSLSTDELEKRLIDLMIHSMEICPL